MRLHRSLKGDTDWSQRQSMTILTGHQLVGLLRPQFEMFCSSGYSPINKFDAVFQPPTRQNGYQHGGDNLSSLLLTNL